MDVNESNEVFSEGLLNMDMSTVEFLIKHIEKTMDSQDAKKGTFYEDSEFKQLVTGYKNEEMDFSYRHSLCSDGDYLVLKAKFKLEKGDPKLIQEKIDDLSARRKEKQPLEYPSCGSTFKRPEGYFAGKLITDAGLKGYCHGGAAVSDKHAGFIINKDHATATDILELISYVQEEV